MWPYLSYHWSHSQVWHTKMYLHFTRKSFVWSFSKSDWCFSIKLTKNNLFYYFCLQKDSQNNPKSVISHYLPSLLQNVWVNEYFLLYQNIDILEQTNSMNNVLEVRLSKYRQIALRFFSGEYHLRLACHPAHSTWQECVYLNTGITLVHPQMFNKGHKIGIKLTG